MAVVGAGPSGSATARRLALEGHRVVLLERSDFRGPRAGESLAPEVRPLLTELGVWDGFMGLGPLVSYGTRSVWGGSDPLTQSYVMNRHGCGWHVDRCAFDRMLAFAARSAGAELLENTSVVGCDRPADDRWLVRTAGGGVVRSRVLIDATGRAAAVARRLGAGRVLFDRHVGITVLCGGVDVSGEGYVCVETMPSGWWYSAPVPPSGMAVVLMTDGDICRRESLPARWPDLLSSTAPVTANRAKGMVAWGPRVFPAASHRLHRPDHTAPWLAVGDAALTVDPVTGSGVTRALQTARTAATLVPALLAGDTGVLSAYENELDTTCDTYLHNRAAVYAMENRWPDALFWRRRTGSAS
ncbi:alkylhalidase-like protein [Sinosporangium siamense]|uniref:Alkylhalidase-like protein n=1 Tax=Sinosporangium siamense TaxID=1367973 RepID=A0A919VEI3_9ACTN|nr:alkylhalidase-like protein [Sinosporangium siamense]